MISLLAAWILCGGQSMEIWLPIMKDTVVLEPWLYIAMATPLLWISINATNCTDGVDGLSASLTSMGIFFWEEFSTALLAMPISLATCLCLTMGMARSGPPGLYRSRDVGGLPVGTTATLVLF